MPPANLTGTIRLEEGRGGSCAPPSEFDVIYECCLLVSTVLPIYTSGGKLFAESGENSPWSDDVKTDVQRMETSEGGGGGGGRMRKKRKEGKPALEN